MSNGGIPNIQLWASVWVRSVKAAGPDASKRASGDGRRGGWFTDPARTQQQDALCDQPKPHQQEREEAEVQHTFASLMIAAGVTAKALSTYMGHSSITITLDRYGHLMPGNESVAASSLLDAYLEAAASVADGF
ncbi:MAG: hypothetical protein WKF41_10225 [Gaiellaceae bacterium]